MASPHDRPWARRPALGHDREELHLGPPRGALRTEAARELIASASSVAMRRSSVCLSSLVGCAAEESDELVVAAAGDLVGCQGPRFQRLDGGGRIVRIALGGSPARIHERAPAAPIGERRIGARSQQPSRDVRVPLPGGVRERRPALLRPSVHGGATIQEPLEERCLAVARCQHDCRDALVIPGVNVRTPVKQELDHRGISAHRRRHQRGQSLGVPSAGRCAALQQKLNHHQLTGLGGSQKRPLLYWVRRTDGGRRSSRDGPRCAFLLRTREGLGFRVAFHCVRPLRCHTGRVRRLPCHPGRGRRRGPRHRRPLPGHHRRRGALERRRLGRPGNRRVGRPLV